MANIEFGDTHEERMIVMQGAIQRMHEAIYGNGRPGMMGRFEAFVSAYEAKEDERDRQHAQNRWRLNAIIAILMAIAAYVALVKHG